MVDLAFVIESHHDGVTRNLAVLGSFSSCTLHATQDIIEDTENTKKDCDMIMMMVAYDGVCRDPRVLPVPRPISYWQ